MAAHENSAQPGTAQAGLDVARSGWFTELSTMWKGQGLSFQIEKKLFQDRSDFQVPRLHAFESCNRTGLQSHVATTPTVQDICVFQTEAFGKVLVLDGEHCCSVDQHPDFLYHSNSTCFASVEIAFCAWQV